MELPPGLQAYIVAPDGTVMDYILPTLLVQSDTLAIGRELIPDRKSGTESAVLAQQIRDINRIMEAHPTPPDVDGEFGVLQQASDATYGGFPQDGVQRLYPE